MSDNGEAEAEALALAFDDQKGEMLEDEEMPTFISVSSTGKDISIPYGADGNVELMPIENADQVDNENRDNADQATANDYEAHSTTRSPTSEEQNEEGSVYVVSSGEDNDPSSNSDDDEVDDEDDIDDDDDDDIDDMDEIEAEEEGVGEIDDGQLLGDFSEDEIEKADVMSDDTALRSGPPVVVEQKRSQSLQDLTSDFGTLPRRRTSVAVGNKYNRVQSKVRRYIQDLKEKSRRSAENRLRAIEDERRNQELEAQTREEEGEETEEEGVTEYRRKSRGGRRSLKNYAEQALRDLEMREELSQEEDELTEEEDDRCAIIQTREFKTENPVRQQNQIHRSKKPVVNGQLVHDVKIPKGILVNFTPNGQTQGQNILDVRSIDYDEYMRGSSGVSVEKLLGNEKNLSGEDEAEPEPLVADKACEALPDIEINEVQTVEESPMEVVEQVETMTAQETNDKMPDEALAEIAMMQTQLNQKSTQCKEIREAYEKTLSENFELKQELEDLKKTLAKLTAKKTAPEVVAIAVQTDPPPLEAQASVESKDIQAKENFNDPKLSTSSMGSALSTIAPWTESAGSLPTSNGSIRPLPNLTPLSNAEDSFIGVSNSPEKTPKQPSHAFQTSSRIIKMLSNLTQRKTKGDNMISAINGEDNEMVNLLRKDSTPLNNHRGSNKRKASEMPDNASSLQPSKIPHTTPSGSQRSSNRRSKSEFKYPGDYLKANSQPSEANRNQEASDESRREENTEDLDSGVKCFTYREDDNSLERSFLIQAEDETKYQESLKDGERPPLGVVRECGPYLLGNVEVRMTEINGTINIWGKEVSQESNAEDEPEEEIDVEDELTERGTVGWLKTPNPRATSCGPMSCSTNKKPKIPPLRLSDSIFMRNHHSPSTSTLENFKERRNTDTNDGNNCHCGNSRSFNKLKRYSNLGDDDHSRLIIKSNCRCNNCGNDNCDYAPTCGRVSRHCHADHDCTTNSRAGRCSRFNSGKDSEQSKTDEIYCRNQSLRFNANNCDNDNVTCRHATRKNNDIEDDDVFKSPSTSNQRDGCCRTDNCWSCRPSCNLSTEPLLSHHPHEPPETRRRRSSGKRVRGILMDFLRGCGDCRLTNGPDNKVSPGVIPQIRIRSSTPPPTLLSQTHNQQRNDYGSTNNRCAHTERCSTCSQKVEMAAEIEKQLDIFGEEMARLHSKSRALLGILNTLHSPDTN